MARQGRSGGTTLPPDALNPELPPDIEADADADPESSARGICLRLLAMRDHTRGELAVALARRGVPEAAASKVLDRYTEVGLVDDEAFAATFTRSRQAERGLSGREIARQLRAKGVADSVVEQAVAAIDSDAEQKAARELADRKLRSMSRLADEVKLRRLVAMLARKGYASGMAFGVCRDAIRDEAARSPGVSGASGSGAPDLDAFEGSDFDG
jgi:regulatory protein